MLIKKQVKSDFCAIDPLHRLVVLDRNSVKSFTGLLQLFREGNLEHNPKLLNYPPVCIIFDTTAPTQASEKLLEPQASRTPLWRNRSQEQS